jgi:hypothetical protein
MGTSSTSNAGLGHKFLFILKECMPEEMPLKLLQRDTKEMVFMHNVTFTAGIISHFKNNRRTI